MLTSTPVRWFFFLMIFGEPLMFTIVLIGSETYSDTFFDRALEGMGEAWAFTVMLLGFAGFILWMIVFIFLTNLAKELRRELPGFPDYRPRKSGRSNIRPADPAAGASASARADLPACAIIAGSRTSGRSMRGGNAPPPKRARS